MVCFLFVIRNNQRIVYRRVTNQISAETIIIAQAHASYVYDDAMRDYKNYLSGRLSNTTQTNRWLQALKSLVQIYQYLHYVDLMVLLLVHLR